MPRFTKQQSAHGRTFDRLGSSIGQCSFAFGLMIAVGAFAATMALAQASVPRRGDGAIALSYQYAAGGDHLLNSDALDGFESRGYQVDGKRWFVGETTSQTILGSLDFGVINRYLALTAQLAYVSSRYEGNLQISSELDDGRWHGTLQDMRIQLRGQLIRAPLIVTPYLSYGFPTTGYLTEGHAAVGRGLTELQLGAFLQYPSRVSAVGPYAHGALAYGILEEVGGLNLGRPQLNLELGYRLSWRWRVRGFGAFAGTTGGVDWVPDNLEDPGIHEEFEALHNQVVNSQRLMVGAGSAYQIWDSVGIFGNLAVTAWGENIEEFTMFSGRARLVLLFSPRKTMSSYYQDAFVCV